jgi:hypothetical protein
VFPNVLKNRHEWIKSVDKGERHHFSATKLATSREGKILGGISQKKPTVKDRRRS